MKMKKQTLILIFMLGMGLMSAMAQSKKQPYKDCEVCNAWSIHKGKKLHGLKYCVGYATIRKYQTGKIDTIGGIYLASDWMGDTYDRYMKLSDRGKYIVDSLKEDGVPELQQSYLTYEPIYMKPGRKVETFWDIQGPSIVITKYELFNGKKGTGFSLVSENTLK